MIAGDQYRKTRLHDEKGHRVDLKYLYWHGPLSLASYVVLRLSKHRPVFPYIPYAAAHAIDRLLTSDSTVLEFGSGMSTIWLARRCGHLYSVEDSEQWFDLVSTRLHRDALDNVTYALHPDQAGYVGFPEARGVRFDVILVDGSFRAECLQRAVTSLKPGGSIYLDDVDKDMTIPDGNMRRAESYLHDVVSQCGGTMTYYTDFAVAQLTVKTGVLAHVHDPSLVIP